MEHQYHLTRVSSNSKTGPIPVSTSSKSTCPSSCPLKGNGCYADFGPLALHWSAVSEKGRGYDLDKFCREIERLPRGQLWRFGQAGDLPGQADQIDTHALEKIVQANKGRRGFAYTHYPAAEPQNAGAIRAANENGFTVSLSANTLTHADELADLDIGPVVTLLPQGVNKPLKTPGGRLVCVCPATVHAEITCAICGLCAKNRKTIIGFPAHGTGKSKAQQVFWMRPEARAV